MNDRFQFAVDYDLNYWSKEKLNYSSDEEKDESFVNLNNSDFNAFRNKIGKGKDFFWYYGNYIK